MSNYSPILIPVIGTRSDTTLTGVQLESTYQTEAASKPTFSFPTGGYERASIDIYYTMGATETSNSIEVKIEESWDRTNWVRVANDSTSGGTSTLTAREFTFVGTNADLAAINIVLDVAYKFMKISVKETGVVTNKGSVFVEAVLSRGA